MHLRDGTETEDPRLDRLVQFDERSRNFPIRQVITQVIPRGYTWRIDTWLDQGNEGACVGFSMAHELAARPVVVPGMTNQFARESIYWQAQRTDDWEGGAYPGAVPQYEGTSVLAGAKTLKALGYISEYRWAFGVDDVRLALGYKGPVVLGINWYSGMDTVDAQGYGHVSGSIRGGHAIVAYSNSERYKRVTLHNSWGAAWGGVGVGLPGRMHLSHADLARLLSEDGEACIPVGRSL